MRYSISKQVADCSRGMLVVVLILIFQAREANATLIEQIVYDSIPIDTSGLGGRGFAVYRTLGQKVDLAGEGAHVLSRLEVMGSFHGTTDPTPFVLSLYNATGPDTYPDAPGELLWQGRGQTTEKNGSYVIVGASLPDILAADTVVWTISRVPELLNIHVTGSSYLAVGNGLERLGMNNGEWTKFNSHIGFYSARITALIPEPSTLLLGTMAGLGCVLYSTRTRNRTS